MDLMVIGTHQSAADLFLTTFQQQQNLNKRQNYMNYLTIPSNLSILSTNKLNVTVVVFAIIYTFANLI